MNLINFILNVVGLLLWLNWRSARLDPLSMSTPATLVGTLKRAEARHLRSWHLMMVLTGLLLFRGFLYWQIGSAVDWNPSLELGAISIIFRSDFPGRILLFSFLSFGATLGVFYILLLVIATINRPSAADPVQRLINQHLGWINRLHWTAQVVLPFIAVTLLWQILAWLFTVWHIIPPPVSHIHRLEQGAVIGLSTYLTCKYVIGTVLLLWLVSSYVYFGSHPFWNFVAMTGSRLVYMVRWLPLRVGKVDFAPIVVIAGVFFLAQLAEHGLTLIFQRLPV